jgi:hypothetical protein
MATHTHTHAAWSERMSITQLLATVVAVTFVLVGVLGFVPGVVSHYDDMTFAGHESDAMLLGLFDVSVLHNVVHLLFGVVGLAMARTAMRARTFLLAGGLVYLVLWAYGLAVDQASTANFVPINDADNWLHLGLGAGMLVLGAVAPAMDRRGR